MDPYGLLMSNAASRVEKGETVWKNQHMVLSRNMPIVGAKQSGLRAAKWHRTDGDFHTVLYYRFEA